MAQGLSASLKTGLGGKNNANMGGFPPALGPASLGYLGNLLATLRPLASFNASLARCLAVLAFLVAATGYGSLVLIYATRHLTSLPPVQTAPLYFDYSGPVATAAIDLRSQLAPFPKPFQELMFPRLAEDPVYMQLQQQLQQSDEKKPRAQTETPPRLPTCSMEESGEELPAWHAMDGGDSTGRLLSPAQKVRITVELQLPSTYSELFQLSGELLSGKGDLLDRAVRTYVAMGVPMYVRFLRQLALAPCFAMGYCSDMISIEFEMFEGYVERTLPLQGFRAVLSSRRSAFGMPPPPPIGAATLKMELQMGLLRTLLYWVRPSLGTMLVIVPAAGLLAVTASGTAMFFVVASVILKHLAEQLPTTMPVAVPRGLLVGSMLSRSQDASSANKSFSTSTEDVNGSREDEDEDEEELEDEASEADVAWQEEGEEEEYLESSEAWEV